MRIIGDVHGKLAQYKKLTNGCDFSICVGDFGFKDEWDWHAETKLYERHLINAGNHDYGPYLKNGISSCGDFRYFQELNLFTVRGANSIDRYLRTEGVDWFQNEELNYTEQMAAFDAFVDCRPNIVVSHDCPQRVMEQLFGYTEKSQTRQMLQFMFNEHKPDLWIFGHHHKSRDIVIDGTRFICLAELETFDYGIF